MSVSHMPEFRCKVSVCEECMYSRFVESLDEQIINYPVEIGRFSVKLTWICWEIPALFNHDILAQLHSDQYLSSCMSYNYIQDFRHRRYDYSNELQEYVGILRIGRTVVYELFVRTQEQNRHKSKMRFWGSHRG